ncbi:MAG: prepilin-type N-terminal cleavage/methylation domain-containing protein [Oscillospiraceae bacterium]|nr:prepilin-type N-terminal cleavage/methylation domain-containing protein [Oscillospiraceae bacterium]
MVVKLRQKIIDRRGFTLAETLVTILILLMVSSVMATGIPVARNAYEKVVLAADADLLLSTAVSALRNELGTVKNPEKNIQWADAFDGGYKTILFYNENIGATSMISLGDTKPEIKLQLYAKENNNETDLPFLSSGEKLKTSSSAPLVSGKASAEKLYVTYKKIQPDSADPRLIIINNLQVKPESDANKVLAEIDSLSIRILG